MRVYFATGNPHKVQEVRDALPENVTVEQLETDVHEIDAADVADVARQKVQDAYAEHPDAEGLVIVDDTGLYVDALDGFPGSQSAFFLERCGVEGLLQLLEGEDQRDAFFKTAMAILDTATGEITVLEGRCDGSIARVSRGDGGFGYDVVFVPEGHDATFAEDEGYKSRVSHRVRVVEKLVDWVNERG